MPDKPTPDDAARWDAVDEAAELLREERSAEAIPMLRATLERDPGNVYAHFYLGSALAHEGRHGPALAAFTEAEKRAPEYLGAVVAKGWCLHELDRFAEAIRAGERALELRAEDPDALYLLGMTHAEHGGRRAAIGYLERFVATRPKVEARHEAEALIAALKGKARPLEPV